MPNQRNTDKKKIGVWVTPSEQKQLAQALHASGYDTLAELLRAIASGETKIPKTRCQTAK